MHKITKIIDRAKAVYASGVEPVQGTWASTDGACLLSAAMWDEYDAAAWEGDEAPAEAAQRILGLTSRQVAVITGAWDDTLSYPGWLGLSPTEQDHALAREVRAARQEIMAGWVPPHIRRWHEREAR